jgi:hypothetical protein
MRWLSFGVAAFVLMTTAARAQFMLASTAGATCVIAHEGKSLQTYLMRGTGDEHAGYLVTPHLYPEIVVTCSKPGYKTRSQILKPELMRAISTPAPCSPPRNATPEELTAYCDRYYAPGAESAPFWEYPSAHLYLGRDDEK